MIEFVHDECQIDPLLPGMISPSDPQTVGAIVARLAYFTTDRDIELPNLSSPVGFGKSIHLGIEEHEVL